MLFTVLVVAAAVSAQAIKLSPNSKMSMFDTAFASPPPPNMDTDTDTFPAGFVYENFYSGKDCSGPIVAVTGHPTDLCLLTYQDVDNGTPTGSVRYTCNSGTMYSESFTDLECTQALPTVQNQLLCENEVGHYGSRMGRCNADPSVLPLPTSANFTTDILYASRDTCQTDIDQFSSYLSGQCIKTSATTSTKYTKFQQAIYAASTTCTGTPTIVNLNQNCDAITAYPVESQLDLADKWAFGPVETGMTFGDGYVYVNLYAEHDCDGPILGVTGHPTNTCLKIYGNATSTEPTGSHFYTCNPGAEFEYTFSDDECSVPESNSTRALKCQSLVGGRFGSGMGMCNADPSRLPIPAENFVTEVLYNSPGVCDFKASFNSFQNDYCFHNGNNGFSYEYPNLDFYQGNPACDGAPSSTQAIPTGCVAVTAYPADTMVASQWFYGYVPYVPSDAPTVSPTAAPTPASYSAGYLYANFYTGKACTGDIVAVAGRPTDTCLTAYEDATTAEPSGSYKFTCSGAMSITTKYSDANCKTFVGNSTDDLTCRNLFGRAGSAGGMCNSDTSRLPLPAANFTTEIMYDSPTACGGKIVEFESYLDMHCFNNGATSLKYEFPLMEFYSGSTCATQTSNQTLWTDCKTITEYPVTDGVTVATKWVYGNVNFNGGSSSNNEDLSTAEIAGIAAGGAVFLVAAAAGAYFFMGAGSSAAASAASGVGASGVNPMVSAV